MLKKNTDPIIESWLEGYNLSTDSTEKKKYLDIGLAECTSPENLLREKLWKQRFTKNEKITGYDFFLAQWIDLSYNRKHSKGPLKGSCEKSMKEIQENLLFQEGRTDSLQEVLYLEYLNMIKEYIELCQTDRNYQKTLLGFKTMSRENLIHKIASDLYSTSTGAAKAFYMEEEFSLLSKAARDAFLSSYPGHEDIWDKTVSDYAKKHG